MAVGPLPRVAPAPTPAPTPQNGEHRRDTSDTATYALTTVFTRPESCTDIVLSISDGTTLYNDLGTTDDVTSVFRFGGSSCYPPQFYKGNQVAIAALYSPGVCPSGMPTAYSAVDPNASVTQVKCCNPGATIGEENGNYCVRDTTGSVTILIDGSQSIAAGKYHILEAPVEVAWAESDLPRFVPPSAPILAAADLTATSASSSTASASSGINTEQLVRSTSTPATPGQSTAAASSSAPSDKDSGLSTGAQAGIGVGAAAVAILFIGLLIWAWFQRKKLKQQSRSSVQGQPGPQWSNDSSPMPWSPTRNGEFKAKYEDEPSYEMTSQRDRSELHG